VGALTETHVVVLAFAAGAGQKVLVKVGGGHYGVFAYGGIMEMERIGVLKALKTDEGFSASLKDVALNACRLFVSPTAQEDELSEEERRATELKEDFTIGSLAVSVSRVYIRVDLPVAGGGGECRRVTACGLTHPPVMR
jgi:hypothetical protein